MDKTVLILGGSFLVLILALIFFNDTVKTTVFGWFTLEARNKDNVKIQNIKSKSDIDVKTREGQDVDIQDIDDSKIKIN